jgi:hypothetical protein
VAAAAAATRALAQAPGGSAPGTFYERGAVRIRLFYNNMTGWGPELVKRRPEITMEVVDRFLTRMYRTNADFVFTVTPSAA